MSILLKISRIIDRLSDWLGNLSVYIVMLTVSIGFINVVLRYVGQITNSKLTNNVIIETQWYLYTLIFLFGFGYILQHQINVRVDFWFAEQSIKTKAAIDFIGHLLALLPYSILALWVTWNPVLTSWGRNPNGTWCFADNPSLFSIITYMADILNLAGRYCGEVSPDPNGLPRAPIKTMILVGFGMLLLQGISEMIKLAAVLTENAEYAAYVEATAPIRIE